MSEPQLSVLSGSYLSRIARSEGNSVFSSLRKRQLFSTAGEGPEGAGVILTEASGSWNASLLLTLVVTISTTAHNPRKQWQGWDASGETESQGKVDQATQPRSPSFPVLPHIPEPPCPVSRKPESILTGLCQTQPTTPRSPCRMRKGLRASRKKQKWH